MVRSKDAVANERREMISFLFAGSLSAVCDPTGRLGER
jgi:hypothetical protein